MNTYIISCKKLKDRLKDAKLVPEELGLDHTITKVGDSESLSEDFYQSVSSGNDKRWLKRILAIKNILMANAIHIHQKNGSYRKCLNEINGIDKFPNWMKPRSLEKGEISVLMKHYYALTSIANGKYRYGLIIEDDVRIRRGSRERFNDMGFQVC